VGGNVLSDQRNAGLQNEAYDKQGMLTAIRKQFRIDWHGIHGANHWARVLHHGMAIGAERSADLLIVELYFSEVVLSPSTPYRLGLRPAVFKPLELYVLPFYEP
jgi:hypothetical protein